MQLQAKAQLAGRAQGHAVQPVGQAFRLPNAVGSARQHQEGSLKSIVTVGVAGQPAAANAPDQRPMAHQQRAKRFLIALMHEARQKLRITFRLRLAEKVVHLG